METMHAAVVTSFDEPPHYQEFEIPTPAGDDQELVSVLAAGLHPRVRTGASGRHYTSTGELPMIPGIDGVGQLPMGGGSTSWPTTASPARWPSGRWSICGARCRSPDDADVELLAAAINPAMSSWVSLRRRVPIEAGQSVLVLGATGNAGTMAVQVARRLGAGRVVGAGRDAARLKALKSVGADEIVQLTDDADATGAALAAAAAEVDIVIDYLWGAPAGHAMMALLTARSDRSRAMDWIQIGAMAGPAIELPSVALRSANLRIQGTGQGAVSARGYLEELPALIDEIDSGAFQMGVRAVPLRDVEAAWEAGDVAGERVVIVP